LQATIAAGAFVPLLDPAERKLMHVTILETVSEALDVYLEENELRWRCVHVRQYYPEMPMEAVFRAVSLTVGISAPRLRTIWYVSRRKSRIKELIQKKIRGEK
jgi:hypothetical protein